MPDDAEPFMQPVSRILELTGILTSDMWIDDREAWHRGDCYFTAAYFEHIPLPSFSAAA